jgi:hypothetical protein
VRDWAVAGGFALIGMTIGAVVAFGIVLVLGIVVLEFLSNAEIADAGSEIVVLTAILAWFAATAGVVVGASIGGTIGGIRANPEGRKLSAGIKGSLLGLMIGVFLGIPVICGLLYLFGEMSLN